MVLKGLLLVVFCYLIGSLPFSYIISRWLGQLDIREHGSGNVGATNVLRTLGWQAAVVAMVGDVLKGTVAAWLGTMGGGGLILAGCCLAVVLGHCYPVFLSFRGGKGVATSAGVFLYLAPGALFILLGFFLLVVVIFRYVSLGSILSALLAPFAVIFLYQHRPWMVTVAILLALVIIYRHRENIDRLRRGKEPKIFS